MCSRVKSRSGDFSEVTATGKTEISTSTGKRTLNSRNEIG